MVHILIIILYCVYRVGGEEDDLSSDDTSDMDSDSDTPPTDNKLCQSGAGSSKMDPALNSAGSSDEGVQSKPSDEEDVGSVAKAGGGCSDGGNGGTVEGDKAATATLETPPGGGETEVERGGSEGCDTAGEAVNGKEEVLEKVESQDKEVIENESKKEVSPQNPEDDVSCAHFDHLETKAYAHFRTQAFFAVCLVLSSTQCVLDQFTNIMITGASGSK